MSLEPNTLHYDDCLEWPPRFPSQSVDLIYLDPSFNSNQCYNLIFGNGAKRRTGDRIAQVRTSLPAPSICNAIQRPATGSTRHGHDPRARSTCGGRETRQSSIGRD